MILIRLPMEILAFVALIAVIPLALLEFLSIHAWICFTGNRYCEDDVSKEQLQNDRNFILIGFFTCISILGFYKRMVKTPLKANNRCGEKSCYCINFPPLQNLPSAHTQVATK